MLAYQLLRYPSLYRSDPIAALDAINGVDDNSDHRIGGLADHGIDDRADHGVDDKADRRVGDGDHNAAGCVAVDSGDNTDCRGQKHFF